MQANRRLPLTYNLRMRLGKNVGMLAIVPMLLPFIWAQRKPPAPASGIKIVEIEFTGLSRLQPTDFDDVAKLYKGKTVSRADWDKTLTELQERVLDVYQQRGYFKALAQQATKNLATEDDPEVRVVFNVEEGQQYRLKSIE